MSKVFMNKRKTATAIIAVALCAVMIFGGTFAWQSIQQEALNEVSAVVNPGGRLHDDFNDITAEDNAHTMKFDKNVYVENFTSYAENGVQIFARIRLDEYMELGVNAGNPTAADYDAKSVVPGAELGDKTTWTPHVPNNTEDPFHKYWNWDLSEKTDTDRGVVTFMPTYNKNKDSLEADINGTFDADFDDYVDYTKVQTQNYYEIEDVDGNDTDELAQWDVNIDDVIKNGQIGENYKKHVSVTQEEHTAKQSLTAYVITMEEWLARPADQQTGDFWVWDADGWAYWANPISPETATGALLEGIQRTETVINDDWYYAINVVGQFITKDNLGRTEHNGFYTDDYETPSKNALTLLNAIGVEVNTEVNAGDVDGLQNALNLGGNIKLNGAYEAAKTVEGVKLPVSFAWTTGGSLTDGTLSSTVQNEDGYAVLFVNAEKGWPEDQDGAAAAIVNNVTVVADERSAITVQAIDADVALNEVTVENTYGAGVYADYGTGKVTLNGCKVTAPTADTGNARDWALCAVSAAREANVVINGGEYTGKYAAYVYSTGGTITILDGYFNGELKADAGKIVIKGGTFTVDPSEFVDQNTYVVDYDEDTKTWTVK